MERCSFFLHWSASLRVLGAVSFLLGSFGHPNQWDPFSKTSPDPPAGAFCGFSACGGSGGGGCLCGCSAVWFPAGRPRGPAMELGWLGPCLQTQTSFPLPFQCAVPKTKTVCHRFCLRRDLGSQPFCPASPSTPVPVERPRILSVSALGQRKWGTSLRSGASRHL